MRRVLDFVTKNKTIIIIVVLIIVLVGTIYFMNNSDEARQTTTNEVKSAEENQLARVLSSIEGVGKTDVMINREQDEIVGVIVVCEGADRIMVRNDILNAVSTALNVEKSIIAIYSMKI